MPKIQSPLETGDVITGFGLGMFFVSTNEGRVIAALSVIPSMSDKAKALKRRVSSVTIACHMPLTEF